MAFDSGLPATYSDVAVVAKRADFLRSERLVVLTGAAALGAVFGFSATIMTGRADLWTSLLIAAPMLVLALHLTSQTLTEAISRDARGCSVAAGMHGAALIAWPMASLLAPFGAYWFAPVAALSALVLFASCWGGPPRAVYRMAVQGALVAALGAHQAALLIMGG